MQRKMDRLPNELLLVIIKKLVVFGIKDLFNFRETFRRHCYLVDKKAAFKLLPTSYLRFFVDGSPSATQVRFVQRFSYSGHASVCVVSAAHLLLRPQPDLEAIRDILAKGVKHNSDGAKYLEIILEVLAIEGFLEDRVFPSFSDLFFLQQLDNCRCIIKLVHDLHPTRGDLALRSMHFGLVYKFTCPFVTACKGSQRFRNIDSPLPGADEDYPLDNFCFLCRLDVEIDWFLGYFRFFDLDFLL